MKDFALSDLEHAPCGFLIFSDTGVIAGINETLLTLLGYDEKEELVGGNIETLFTIAGRIFYQTHFFPLLKLHGKANEIFFSLRTKNRDELSVMCNAVRKEKLGSGVNHCIFMPVTERRKYEQELLNARRNAERALEENQDLIQAKKELEIHTIELDRQLSRLTHINDDISQFSKVVSHDLQESIRKIAIFSDIVLTEVREIIPKDRIRDLEKINSECIRLRELATDIDKFMSLNIITEKIRRLDMNHILQYESEQIKRSFENISFTTDTPPVIEGYEEQIKLLFANVFSHHVGCRSEGAALTISIECSVVQQNSFRAIKGKYRYIDFAKFVITDNASGHRQSDDSIFKLQKKSGDRYINFALPFCKKIVDNHHGDIHMISKNGCELETIIILPLIYN